MRWVVLEFSPLYLRSTSTDVELRSKQAYFAAWALAQVGLFIIGVLIILMVYPPSRHFLFPPAPLSMISATSGGLQKPKAGDKLGSKDR